MRRSKTTWRRSSRSSFLVCLYTNHYRHWRHLQLALATWHTGRQEDTHASWLWHITATHTESGLATTSEQISGLETSVVETLIPLLSSHNWGLGHQVVPSQAVKNWKETSIIWTNVYQIKPSLVVYTSCISVLLFFITYSDPSFKSIKMMIKIHSTPGKTPL